MATVDQTMLKIQRLLTGPMGLRIQLVGDAIRVTFTDSSSAVHLRVVDWGKTKDGEPQTLVRISAPILYNVKPSNELYQYLLREAPEKWFGKYIILDDQDNPGMVVVSVVHTLLGDFLDEGELGAGMYGVLYAADEQDDIMQKRFGGKRWIDT
jgi:hypothetical protein